MAGLAVQNFVSAAVGIAVVVALIRGIVARSGRELGNFWQDLVRILLYILLPVSIVGALFLVSQGVIQNLGHYTVDPHPRPAARRPSAQGPVASQEAIKELGTNGGGFFNVNSAYPFENPSGLTNFFELLLILVIPAGLTYTYGRMVGSQRQGWAIFAAMFVLFVAGVAVVYMAEQHGTAAQHAAGLHTARLRRLDRRQHGGQGAALRHRRLLALDGGDDGHLLRRGQRRLRVADRARRRRAVRQPRLQRGRLRRRRRRPLLDAALRPARRLHRRPDGRPHARSTWARRSRRAEIKLVSLGVLVTPLVGAALLRASPRRRALGKRSLYAGVNPQGFSETLYAYLSQANNNGSAFAGYTGFVQPNAPGNAGAYGITFADLLGGAVMLGARFAADPLRPRRRRRARRQEGLAGRAWGRCAPTTRPSSSSWSAS